MKIALIGASGRVGSRLLAELLSRGHTVTGIARDTAQLASRAGLTVKAGDATQPALLAPLLAGHDTVASAMRFQSFDMRDLIAAMKEAGVPRLVMVGGAATLEVAPGKMLFDAPGFPEAYKSEAQAGGKALEILRKEKDLDWTFLSPADEFAPGERTGKFRVGGEQLLSDASGKSWISMEDYAIAFVDELEAPKHPRQRFTVGY